MKLDIEQLPHPPEVSGINKDNFEEKVANLYTPVVIRDFAGDWPLVQEASKSNADALRYLKRYASNQQHNIVRLDKKYQGRMFYQNENLTQFNFQNDNLSIADGLNLMEQELSNTELPSACFQCVPVKKAFPELASQLTHPAINEQGIGFVWFGSRFRVAPHFDDAQNMAIVGVGQRRFTLFPPEQIDNLYIGPVEKTPAGQPISLVDIYNPDLKKYPRYEIAYQNALSAVLNPGDAIYIPSPWWHHVESLSDFNFLINYWWSQRRTSTELPFPALMHALQAFSSMSPKEKAAWQSFFNHFVFSQDADRFDHIPDYAKGVLDSELKNKSTVIHNWLAQRLR